MPHSSHPVFIQEAVMVNEADRIDERDGNVFEAIPITELCAERTVSNGENQMEASKYLKNASSLDPHPEEKGWYFATSESSNPDHIKWMKFGRTHSEEIEKAWQLGEKSVMLFNGSKGDDKKIDLTRMYQKDRRGLRRPIIRVVQITECDTDGKESDENEWYYKYCNNEGNNEGAVGGWIPFDEQASQLLKDCIHIGRNSTVIYDGAYSIFINIEERTWSTPVKDGEDRGNFGVVATGNEVTAAVAVTAAECKISAEDQFSLEEATNLPTIVAIPALADKPDDAAPQKLEKNVKLLLEMGFAEDKVREALDQTDGVASMAVDFLCNTL